MGVAEEAGEQFVVRRVVAGGVVVASYHPEIGPVFWDFTDNSDSSAPDHFGLTMYIAGAHRFGGGQVPFRNFQAHIWACNGEAGQMTKGQAGEDDYSTVNAHITGGNFPILARWAAVEVADIVRWFWETPWIETSAPRKAYFLREFCGVDFQPVWTELLDEAQTLSAAEIGAPENIEVKMAEEFGEFVPVVSAEKLDRERVNKGAGGDTAAINHTLEADAAWTLHRSQVRYGGAVMSYGDQAIQHAARAGRQHFMAGCERVSGHIEVFPELRAAFDVGFALAKHLAGAENRVRGED